MATRNKRFFFIILFLLLLIIIFISRGFYLSVTNRDFLKKQADLRSVRLIELPAYRGKIFDRNGELLAISTPVQSICANPKEIIPDAINEDKLSQVANILGIKLSGLKNLINNKNKEFVYIKRQVPPEVVRKIENLNLPGFFTQLEYKRFYPHGEIFSNLIGITDIDENGIEGIEYLFNKKLSPTRGLKKFSVDRLGHVIDDIGTIRAASNGSDLYLSVDTKLQFLGYKELKKTVDEFLADYGFIISLDITNGEILSLVNYPAYNPNSRTKIIPDEIRNRAVTDLFEPGSSFKPIVMAGILDKKKYPLDMKVSTSPGKFKIGDDYVSDVLDYGTLDLTGIIKKSSNIGMAKLALHLRPSELLDIIEKSGFLVKTHSNLPGELSGSLSKYSNFADIDIATLSFGYGISVSGLQLVNSYATIARHGEYYPLSILHDPTNPKYFERVYSAKTSNNIMYMLNQVVDGSGTGRRAKLASYTVAGKTGTARLINKNGSYSSEKHSVNFVGISPSKNPRIVTLVFISNPKLGSHYGGVIAAPVFANITEDELRILGEKPDKS